MGIFNLFKKKESQGNGFFTLSVKDVQALTADSVMITFNTDESQEDELSYKPGQYLDIEANVNGEKVRRSYSICSSNESVLSIGVKAVPQGKMSKHLQQIRVGETLEVSTAKGNFTTSGTESHIVCIAAGSGITPIFSILSTSPSKKQLFYVNKSSEQMMFKKELAEMPGLMKNYYFTQTNEENHQFGRLNKEAFIEEIKKDLDLLKADAFFLCGPHAMIIELTEALKMFGVADSKIKFELFQAVVQETPKQQVNFTGESTVDVTLDGETSTILMHSAKKTILEVLDAKGIDAPYSCRGGVCCSCKAKLLEGTVTMKVNYSLTEEEVQAGYILTCQALPNSSIIKLTFDE